MKTDCRYFFALFIFIAPLVTGCNKSTTSPDAGAAVLIEHQVSPSTTDPAASSPNDKHICYIRKDVTSNQKLFVYFGGTEHPPSDWTLLPKEAAAQGYSVINLCYPSVSSAVFGPIRDSLSSLPLYEPTRLEMLDGIDRSTLIAVTPANSVLNRFIKLIEYLHATYPAEGWGKFLDLTRQPVWSSLVLAGSSQGGGTAAFIAKYHAVDRVVMFSAGDDGITTSPQQSPPWLQATGLTPADRHYGFAHTLDPVYLLVGVNWSGLGMTSLGAITAIESSSPPYNNTHRITTSMPVSNPHSSTSADFATPVQPDGTPVFREAWHYVIGR